MPVVVGVATVVFVVLHLAPGDPASLYAGPGVSAEALERIRANMGLDEPLHTRYVMWISSTLQGDFGQSLARGRPVAQLFGQALPNTLILAGTALALAFLVGTAIGVLQAARHNTWTDSSLSVGSLFFYSMPSFWLALMLVLVFSLYARNVWGWPVHFPASGMVSLDHGTMTPWGQVVDRARHLALPVLSLTLVLAGGIARYARASMLEVLTQDYIRMARAKGLPRRTVLLKHGLRNGLIPVVTLLGFYLPLLFSGTVFVETVFAWPGMGKLVVDAIGQRDYPVVMAGALLFAVMVVVGNLLADLLYSLVDPRIRYE